jgi:hypothetical protein
MVPTLAEPPKMPLTDQVTAESALPVTVAENARLFPSASVDEEGATATLTGGNKVTAAVAIAAGFATDVADTVTTPEGGTAAGGV